MKLKKFFVIFLTTVFLFQILPINAFAQERYTCQDPVINSRLKKENLVVTRSLSKLSADTAKPDDIYKFKVLDDIAYENKIIIPCGSIIEGKVVKVRKTSMLRIDAYIDLLITSVQNNSVCINLEKEPIKIRITDPHYKSFMRGFWQRTPVTLCNTATSIALTAATNMSSGVILAIETGVGIVTGFASGFVDPDIDKTRVNGGIVRGVEGTLLGTFLIVTEQGFDVKYPESCVVVIKFDDKLKQKLACAMQNAVISATNY